MQARGFRRDARYFMVNSLRMRTASNKIISSLEIHWHMGHYYITTCFWKSGPQFAPHFRSQLWRVNGWALAHMPQPCAHSWQHHCTVWANPSSLHIIPKVALVRAHHCMYKLHFTHRIPSSSIKVCSKRGLRPWPGVRISMSCLGSLDVTTMRILSMVICCVLQWRHCCGPHWCIDEQIPGQLWEKPINISIVFMTTG